MKTSSKESVTQEVITQKPIGMLMDEIEGISSGLIEKLFEEEDSNIDYPSFYARQNALCLRIKEIFSRKFTEQARYFNTLKLKLNVAVKDEDYLSAAHIKKQADYFRRGFLDNMPEKYI
jgi:hypothetical protein